MADLAVCSVRGTWVGGAGICGGGSESNEFEGTLDFQQGGAYVATLSIHAQGHVSEACLNSWDRSCGESPFQACEPSQGGGCDCDYTSEPNQTDPGMTWSASGNVVQLTNGCEITTMYYCVEGDVLKLRGTNPSGDQVHFIEAAR